LHLDEQMEGLGRSLAEREAQHAGELQAAGELARSLHAGLAGALDRFHAAARSGGAPHLEILLNPPRTDEKHVHSVQFDVARGRHRAIVTVKSRGEVTLVGPFKAGKQEGPCQTFASDSLEEIEGGLAQLLQDFVEVAFAP
jgi:hypothetical protein